MNSFSLSLEEVGYLQNIADSTTRQEQFAAERMYFQYLCTTDQVRAELIAVLLIEAKNRQLELLPADIIQEVRQAKQRLLSHPVVQQMVEAIESYASIKSVSFDHGYPNHIIIQASAIENLPDDWQQIRRGFPTVSSLNVSLPHNAHTELRQYILKHLDALPGLSALRIYANSVQSLTELPVGDWSKVQQLDVDMAQLQSTATLSNFQQLRTLCVQSNRLTDLAELETLQNLEHAQLVCTNLRLVDQLGSCKALQRLFLYTQSLEDYTPLSSLPDLQECTIVTSRAQSLDTIGSLTQVKTLRLESQGPIADWTFLESCLCLNSLSIDAILNRNVVEVLAAIPTLCKLTVVRRIGFDTLELVALKRLRPDIQIFDSYGKEFFEDTPEDPRSFLDDA